MALQNNRYQIEIKVNDEIFDAPATSYSFIIRDSIFNLYPIASLFFNDTSGQFNEYLTFINGIKVNITYGTENEFIICPFIVAKNSVPNQSTQVNIGGVNEISLIHEYLYNQNKVSFAFNDEISNIINKKVSKYPFTSINIDKTFNKGTWYQPLMNDAEFMQTILLPFAFSTDAENSPYYLYIDCNNEFYFKSYKKLFNDAKVVTDLVFAAKGTTKTLTQDTLSSINNTQMPLSELREIFNRLLFYFDSDGVYIEDNDRITDYPKNAPNDKIPIKWNLENTTNVTELLYDDILLDSTENNRKGMKIFSMRNSFHIDRVVIVSNLNTKLKAGKKINLLVPFGTDKQKVDLSIRHSGEYLIESTYHKWNGISGLTIVIASRQSTTNIPSAYLRKEEILSR
jgi:hypothetical protein